MIIGDLIGGARCEAGGVALLGRRVAGSTFAAVLICKAAYTFGGFCTIVWRVAERLVSRWLVRDAAVGLDHVIDAAGLAVGPTVTVVSARHTVTAATERADLAVGVVAALHADLAI